MAIGMVGVHQQGAVTSSAACSVQRSTHESIVSILLSVAGRGEVVFSNEDMTTLQQQFGNVVKRRRQAAGLSQEALAGRAGLHRTYIGLLERGMRMPSIEVVKKVAKALDVTMTVLVAELEGLEVEVLQPEQASQEA
jgi:ribosome-binding protein aMBF1 (putative translation factor)